MNLFLRNLIHFTYAIRVVIVNLQSQFTSATIGVNYGMLGDNLPSPSDVINLYKKENITLLRLFDPNTDVLNALKGSGINVCLGVRNENVTDIAMNVNTAMGWVNTYVAPYASDVNFGWITLGNEMVPTGPGAELLPQAMNNIQSGLSAAGLTSIKVSTVVNGNVLGASYPPSAGDFSSEAGDIMKGITIWLQATNNPLLINVYPYIAYASDPGEIPLDYALFNPQQPVIDGNLVYASLLEAMVDAYYAALEKNGGENVTVVVSETGWPTAGNEPYTNIETAQTYNQRLIYKMKQFGTPRRPSVIHDIFIFAMFNENQKPAGVEQNWGLYYPTMEPVYPLTF